MQRIALFVLLTLISGSSLAWTCDKIGVQSETVSLAANAAAARDVPVGSAISDWNYSVQQTYRTCTSTAGATQVIGVAFGTSGLVATAGITFQSDSGVSIPVYDTGLAGVGVAIESRGWTCSSWSGWEGAKTYQGSYLLFPSGSGLYGCIWSSTNAHTLAVAGQIGIRLIKTGTVSPGKVKLGNSIVAYSVIDGNVDWGADNTRRWFNSTEVTISASSCATPSVSVNLGEHRSNAFPEVGSRTSPVKFDLKINDCPAGMSNIRYGFNFPSGTGYTPTDGLFGLKADATAKGIKVKLMTDKGDTVQLDKWYTLSDYNRATGGSYVVPLSAAYERTGDVTAGSADAELTIAMNYQ
ncbi:hypothetical protein GCM10007235_18210 [Pseudoxanthomonas indica]|nr:hypothetical protein GCM10007235_18210 [Pseudoxanthomonas indica]